MNPVDIVVDQRDSSSSGTVVDDVFDEPITTVARQGPITISGQVNYGTGANERLQRSRTGDIGDSRGHFVFRKTDLDEASVVLKKGDIVTSVAGVAVSLEIIQIRHQCPLKGVFLTTVVEFRDRSEVRAST